VFMYLLESVCVYVFVRECVFMYLLESVCVYVFVRECVCLCIFKAAYILETSCTTRG